MKKKRGGRAAKGGERVTGSVQTCNVALFEDLQALYTMLLGEASGEEEACKEQDTPSYAATCPQACKCGGAGPPGPSAGPDDPPPSVQADTQGP